LHAARAFLFFVASGKSSNARSTTVFSLVAVIAFIAPSNAGIACDGAGEENVIEAHAPAIPKHLRANWNFNPWTLLPRIDVITIARIRNMFVTVTLERDDIEDIIWIRLGYVTKPEKNVLCNTKFRFGME
jgi:hypothetical protein